MVSLHFHFRFFSSPLFSSPLLSSLRFPLFPSLPFHMALARSVVPGPFGEILFWVEFLDIQKINKKIARQKTTFFDNFCDFHDFLTHFLSSGGRFCKPVGKFCRLFFWVRLWTIFLYYFFRKSQELKKMKPALIVQDLQLP